MARNVGWPLELRVPPDSSHEGIYMLDFITFWGLPDSSVGKESACNAGDPGLIPGLGRSTGEGIGYPLRYSWASLVAQLVKNPLAMWETWIRSLGWEDPLEKGKAPPLVFWPGEFHGLCSPWGRKELDMTFTSLEHWEKKMQRKQSKRESFKYLI